MKKTVCIVFVNIILLSVFIFSVEVIIWSCENLRIKIHKESHIGKLPLPFHPGVKRHQIIGLDDFSNPAASWTRKPEGLNYTKKPVVIFGCSFAYGFGLENEQTFSYKLSKLAERPVYNRAMPGWGIQHMLNQVRRSDFYKDVPESEYVIFIMINDHFRRLYAPTFMSSNLITENYYLRYEYKDGQLVQKRERNKFLETLQRLYFVQKTEHVFINNILLNKDNYKQYFDFALEHFIESKREMEKHWKNTKYVIVLYQYFWYDEIFIKQLQDNGFIVIYLPRDYRLDMGNPEYLMSNFHPAEKAWDVITPKIIETLNL